MAKTQTVGGGGRQFFGWFGRHKVATVFGALVVLVVLFFVGSWVVLQVQIHFERARFNSAAHEIDRIRALVQDESLSKTTYSKTCMHSNFGAIFETDSISCDTEVKAIYSNISNQDASKLAQSTKSMLIQQGLKLQQSNLDNNARNLASYDFTYHKLSCSFGVKYYDAQTSVDLPTPVSGSAAVVDVDCGGKALKDYFPVVKD